jgi:tetratricopeptide (TPR) repeat protein
MRRPPEDWLVALALAVLTAFVYWPALDNDYVNWDDVAYGGRAPGVREGLTGRNASRAWTTTEAANWHPLTWLSLQLDAELSGTGPRAFHRTNVLLHAANAALLFAALRALTGSRWRSAAVAALFALHPLHAESVAWVSERKDVLSTFFGLLALWAYAGYTRAPSARRYVLVAALFALSLLAKPMLVTLPFVLLLLDYWPLRRAEGRPLRAAAWPLVREKLPLFALSAASCAATWYAQQQAMAFAGPIPLAARAANAAAAYVGYLLKTLWPADLAAFYPHPRGGLTAGAVAFAVVFLALVTAAALNAGRRRGYLAVGWLWYLGTLVPVLGLVQVGKQALADRYTYVPLIGVFLAAVWASADLATTPVRRRAAAVAAAAVLAVLAVLTWSQAAVWKDSRSLWEHALHVVPDSDVAMLNLGNALEADGDLAGARRLYEAILARSPDDFPASLALANTLRKQGEVDEALRRYARMLEADPANKLVHKWLAPALAEKGDVEGALTHYRRTVECDPDDPGSCNTLAVALERYGRPEEAERWYREAVRLDPAYTVARCNLASNLLGRGEVDRALAEAREAVRLCPPAIRRDADAEDYAVACKVLAAAERRRAQGPDAGPASRRAASPRAVECFNRGTRLGREGQPREAVRYLAEAVHIEPAFAEAHHNLGLAREQAGDEAGALASCREAVRLKPAVARYRVTLAALLEKTGRTAEAANEYHQAARLDPGWLRSVGRAAWRLATHPRDAERNGVQAVEMAEQVCQATAFADPEGLDTLAAAYAEAGRFAEAAGSARKAAELARAAGQADQAREIEGRLRLYEQGRAFRDLESARPPDHP